MKDRIKKFWNDHETKIIFLAATYTTVAVATVAVVKIVQHDNAVTGIWGIWADKEKTMWDVQIIQRNGKMTPFWFDTTKSIDL